MPTYVDLLKLLETAGEHRTTLVLPHPIEEIFPDKVNELDQPPQPDMPWVSQPKENDLEKILRQKYEDLVTSTFEGRA